MKHRHFSNQFTRSGTDQHGNNNTPVEQSYTPTGRTVAPGNGPFAGQTDRGVHSNSHRTSEDRANKYPSIHDVEAGPSNCTTGIGEPLKRKRLEDSRSCERGGSSSFYCAGSSSSSSQMPMEKPRVDCRNVPPYEDSQRNVRRRPTLELKPSHPSHHHRPTIHPENYSAPVRPANLDATSGQWNSVPRYAASSHRRFSPPDNNGSRYEMNQFHVGGSSSDSVFSRRTVSSSQYLHGPRAPAIREGHGNHSRRFPSSYGNGLSHSHHARRGTSTNGLRPPPENFSSRYSRRWSAGGWRGNYRSGRPRINVERTQPILDVTEGHAETIMMMDRSSFYVSSRNFADEYRDLRLDIDSMSYEELLNLEERIGNVSTGLAEESMSKWLKEKDYHSSDQKRSEVPCPICLEDYRNDDKIGMLEKCGHNYHVGCIKKWLLMKKVCPICKSECSNQEPTEG